MIAFSPLRIPLLLLFVVVAVAGRAGSAAAGGVEVAAPPTFELSPAERDRLLFPALVAPPDPAADRCVRSRGGGIPPQWLAEAAMQSSCTSAVRAALAAPAVAGVAATPATVQDLLTAAALCDDVAAIESALAGGADPNRPDSCGWTALVAAAAGHPDSVRALLDGGARVKVESRQGPWSRPPLLAALIARDVVSARILLDARAGANVETPGGRSALQFAAAIRDADLAHILLRRGANACHEDSSGLTPLVVARVYGNKAVFKLLMKATRKCENSKRPRR